MPNSTQADDNTKQNKRTLAPEVDADDEENEA